MSQYYMFSRVPSTKNSWAQSSRSDDEISASTHLHLYVCPQSLHYSAPISCLSRRVLWLANNKRLAVAGRLKRIVCRKSFSQSAPANVVHTCRRGLHSQSYIIRTHIFLQSITAFAVHQSPGCTHSAIVFDDDDNRY